MPDAHGNTGGNTGGNSGSNSGSNAPQTGGNASSGNASSSSSRGGASSSSASRGGATALSHSDRGYFSQIKANLGHNLSERTGSTLLVLLPAVLILAFFLYVATQVFLAPGVKGLADRELASATVLYTAGGEELSRLYQENRSYVPIDSMAATLPQALVAIEDQSFYTHGGVSFRRTVGALLQTAQGNKQGGSTITMQLARNAFTDVADDWIITRKVKEWITAVRINDTYSKDKVLEIYLNTVPFNYNSFGVEAASRVYFNKSAAEIDTLQSATLMAMLRGPTLYNPVRNPEQNRQRRDEVLEAMTETGSLTQAEAQRLQQQDTEMDFQPVDVSHNLAPYFAEYARGKLGDWAKENGYDLYLDGLKVYTTIDAEMQKAADEAVKEVMDDLQAIVDVSWSSSSSPFFSSNESAYEAQRNPETAFDYFWETHPELTNGLIQRSSRYKALTDQGTGEEEALDQLKADDSFIDSVQTNMQRIETGLVSMQPDNGHIKAWVGGRDFEEDQYDHVYLSKRQPGSTFKPFVYATALDRGFRQNDVLRDAKIDYVNEETGQTWSPGNFGGESGELMTLKQGLANSKNTITAQLIVTLGPGRVAETARRMGIKSDLQAVPSLGLGTSSVTLLEMVGAYGSLANVGRYQEPLAITRIENRYGRTVANFQSESRQALPASVAFGTLQMMEAVVTEGTGVRIRQFVDSGSNWAAKTGTTQNNADGWFMLIHPRLVTGSWVGFNSPQITFRTRYWGQGSHNALKVVGHYIENVNLETATFDAPSGYEPPAEGEPRRDPESIFADDDNVSYQADSIAAAAADEEDPFDLNLGNDEEGNVMSSDGQGAEDAGGETGGEATAGADEEAQAETEAQPEPNPETTTGDASEQVEDGTEEIEGQSEADQLNSQQSIETDGGGGN
jgi:penicillin-binding protein 1A